MREQETARELAREFSLLLSPELHSLRLGPRGADGRQKQNIAWIIGHSYVRWAAKRACDRPYGLHLGMAHKDWRIEWMGKPGMHWDQLLPLMRQLKNLRAPPDVVIMHLGGNDLRSVTSDRRPVPGPVEQD
ncbi:uncharacterized protein LOC115094037 isoform X2 [Rhinatrema bivittatum]|uniref:uncharacterized protein LOC115084711 isoform X2 n=1 Tax=Rhinatrema bivittatum TaxID=194408 RepID=UPI001129A668|nr:uncharacterized protein LOC115084711 isoform X2 [Rhinatrema bivittatum]XP_029462532.1 uncharacterized protein LOC115094037 isoform X2 [Rhinatrema bivittatum]